MFYIIYLPHCIKIFVLSKVKLTNTFVITLFKAGTSTVILASFPLFQEKSLNCEEENVSIV